MRHDLGDICIKNVHSSSLTFYLLFPNSFTNTVGNFVISDCIFDDIPPQMKILNMVIPISALA